MLHLNIYTDKERKNPFTCVCGSTHYTLAENTEVTCEDCGITYEFSKYVLPENLG